MTRRIPTTRKVMSSCVWRGAKRMGQSAEPAAKFVVPASQEKQLVEFGAALKVVKLQSAHTARLVLEFV